MATLTSKIDAHDASIKSVIATSQNTITNAINGVKNDITEQGTTLKNVINTKGCVKSVQRIEDTIGANNTGGDVVRSYNISEVSVNKTVVLIDISAPEGGGHIAATHEFYGNKNLRVTLHHTNYNTVGGVQYVIMIQVIDFY